MPEIKLHINNFTNQHEYCFGKYGYGKNNVKLLHVRRSGDLHVIREYEVDLHLRLSTKKDFLEGDNKDIIATDSQKNTIYILAKKQGIRTPEDFGLLICSHFLNIYKHIENVNVKIQQYPWERHRSQAKPHNHAFIFTPVATRIATITQKRNAPPLIQGGIKDLRVLKTTQSAFKDFIQDDYSTLSDANDRIFSTIVSSNWDYSTTNGVNFDEAWEKIKDYILYEFAGKPDKGVFSPSVQNTLYLTEKKILDEIPQISRIEMFMPNKHYFPVDFSKFSGSNNIKENNEVYQPIDKPSGIIYAEIYRKLMHHHL